MKSVYLREAIRKAHFVEQKSQRQIAQELGISRNTVRRILAEPKSDPPQYKLSEAKNPGSDTPPSYGELKHLAETFLLEGIMNKLLKNNRIEKFILWDAGTALEQSELYGQITSVTSQPHPLPGQKHRSSGNFSTEGVSGDIKKMRFNIYQNGRQNNIITFILQSDRTGGDKVIYRNIKNGSEYNMVFDRALYISDPDGAANQEFLVVVSAV